MDGVSGSLSFEQRKRNNIMNQTFGGYTSNRVYSPRNDKFFGYAQFPSPKRQNDSKMAKHAEEAYEGNG